MTGRGGCCTEYPTYRLMRAATVLKASLWIWWIRFLLRSLQWMIYEIILAISSKLCNSHWSEKKAMVINTRCLWQKSPTTLPPAPSQPGQQQPNPLARQLYPASPHPQRRIHVPFLPPRQEQALAPPFPGWRCQDDPFGDNHTCGGTHWQRLGTTTKQQAEGHLLCWVSNSSSSWTTVTYDIPFKTPINLWIFFLIISTFLYNFYIARDVNRKA